MQSRILISLTSVLFNLLYMHVKGIGVLARRFLNYSAMRWPCMNRICKIASYRWNSLSFLQTFGTTFPKRTFTMCTIEHKKIKNNKAIYSEIGHSHGLEEDVYDQSWFAWAWCTSTEELHILLSKNFHNCVQSLNNDKLCINSYRFSLNCICLREYMRKKLNIHNQWFSSQRGSKRACMHIVTASRGLEGVFIKWSTLTFLESSKPKYAIRD